MSVNKKSTNLETISSPTESTGLILWIIKYDSMSGETVPQSRGDYYPGLFVRGERI
jgi:hypothetical protein